MSPAPQRQPETPRQPPPVQRLRIRYAKRGRLRFSSTRDFQRALERALRRAQVPMAFSSGFHPHPRISYANAAPTGTASEAEYVEIAVLEELDPQAVQRDLDAALPPGLDVLRVVVAGKGSLADRLEASSWELRFPVDQEEALRAAVSELMAAGRAEVSRMMKNGLRTFDVRSALADASVELREQTTDGAEAAPAERGAPSGGPGMCAILQLVVRHTTPSVRPDDIVTALRATSPGDGLPSPLVTRLAQGPLQSDPWRVDDPLDADHDGTAAGSGAAQARADQA